MTWDDKMLAIPVVAWFGPGTVGPGLDPSDEGTQLVQVPIPVGHECMLCCEVILDGDYGEMAGTISGSPDALVAQLGPQHGECMLLLSVGHSVGLCGCTNYEGLSFRQAGIEAAKRIQRMAEQ